tara:strand:- start:73 stop:291 length:219 start_codon:yes stop_codon:yes gene_type:complete
MSSHHDNLQVMGTEEILRKNVYDLQEQLQIANRRVLTLMDKVRVLNKKLVEINYSLSGMDIYLSDVKGLLDD